MGRLTRTVAAVLLLPPVLGAGLLYGASEWVWRRPRSAPLIPLPPLPAPDLAEGERLARIVGCWNGCHGARGEGGQEELAGLLEHTAPTLSQVLPAYGDDELARLVRSGIKRDGVSAVGMSSFTFWSRETGTSPTSSPSSGPSRAHRRWSGP